MASEDDPLVTAERSRALRALERVRLFRGLPREMIEEAAANLHEVRFAKGGRLAIQGERLEQALLIVLSGRVRLLDQEGGETPRIVAFLGPGDVYGSLELLTGGPSRATAEALIDTVTMALPHRAFHALLAGYPSAALLLARMLGRRLEAWTSRRGRRRTAVFLGVWAPQEGPLATLAALALARAVEEVAGSRVLLLDTAYAGPRPGDGGAGLVRSLGELTDARGDVDPELLRSRVLHADQGLSFVQLGIPEDELDRLGATVFPALLGEAKSLASYVVMSLAGRLTPGRRAVVEQLEQRMAVVTPEDLGEPDRLRELSTLPGEGTTFGLVLPEGKAPVDPAVFRTLTGRERGFVLPFRDASTRSVLRLMPYPSEALSPEEPAMVRARSLARRVTRRRVGVCLGSGTALGWAHIGVLKVLEREGIPIDCMSASSMGSIVASMYASGWGTQRMEEFAGSVTREKLDELTDLNWPIMRDGLIRGDRLLAFFEGIFEGRDLEDLEIPLLIQACDLGAGRPHIFRTGPVAEAVRASISLPGIFRMVAHGDRYLVDGGVHDTLPIEPLRGLGGDLVIAVNTTQDPRQSEAAAGDVGAYNLFDVFLRSLEVMQQRRTGFEGRNADVVIQPRIRDVTWRELWRAKELIGFGEEAAEASLDEVLRVLHKPPV